MDTLSPEKNQPSVSSSLRLRQLAVCIHRLGPRPLFELLVELDADLATLETFADLDKYPRDFLAAIGATNFPPINFAVAK